MTKNNQHKLAKFTVPGMNETTASRVLSTLDNRMVALLDLALTLKHVHWNVVGPNFISVHEMLDPQVDSVRDMTDTIAERIATLGGTPLGTPQSISDRRTWNDYSLGKALVMEHLGALDLVYTWLTTSHRIAMIDCVEVAPVSDVVLIGRVALVVQSQC